MADRLMHRHARRAFMRTVSLHPSAGHPAAMPPVLIIAHDQTTCVRLERVLPPAVRARSVRSASDTEGIGARVIVIGGPFPLAEVVEVRAHPKLFDKPVVLFAPSKELPPMDWSRMDIWPVVAGPDPSVELVARVRYLLGATEVALADAGWSHGSLPAG